MKKQNNFIIEIPQNAAITQELKNIKAERINFLKDTIKKQYDELYKNLDNEITLQNEKSIRDLVFATQDLIDNCIKDDYYYGNRDEYFISLIYLCHKLDLKLETYKLKEQLNNLEEKNIILNQKQEQDEEKNNNLIYNLLGILTAFSIVSAVVGVVAEIDGIINIMLFIIFTILILLTTLIALHNFYENNNNRDSKLQDNYFLWKFLICMFIFLIIASGIKFLNDNKNLIFNYIDKKIESVIEQKIEKNRSEEIKISGL